MEVKERLGGLEKPYAVVYKQYQRGPAVRSSISASANNTQMRRKPEAPKTLASVSMHKPLVQLHESDC